MKRNLLRNNRGSISSSLGVDLFATLLLVFLVSTALLLKNQQNDKTLEVPPIEAKERKTANITLPADNQEGFNDRREGAIPVSAKLLDGRKVAFFVGDTETDRSGMSKLLRQKRASRVELRIDERLSNATTVQLLNSIQEAGVREVFYIFQKK